MLSGVSSPMEVKRLFCCNRTDVGLTYMHVPVELLPVMAVSRDGVVTTNITTHPDTGEQVSYSIARHEVCEEWMQSQVMHRRGTIKEPVSLPKIAARWKIHIDTIRTWHRKDKWDTQLNSVQPRGAVLLANTKDLNVPPDPRALENARDKIQSIAGEALKMMFHTVSLANRVLASLLPEEGADPDDDPLEELSAKEKLRVLSLASGMPEQVINMIKVLGINVGDDHDPAQDTGDAVAVIFREFQAKGVNVNDIIGILGASGKNQHRILGNLQIEDKAEILQLGEGGQNGGSNAAGGTPSPFPGGDPSAS